jgi:hypothetical protein
MQDRAGWKGGRFSVDFETSTIYGGLRDWQRWTGDEFYYFRFAYDQSTDDPVYGEADSPNGRIYFGPNLIPALHVLHIEGANDNSEDGFYFNDTAHITMSFDQIKKMGLDRIDLNTQNYLKDRFVYDTKVFRVTKIEVMGQLQQRDIIVTIDATQVKPDEMVNDIQFAQYVVPNDKQFSQRWSLNDTVYDPYESGRGIYPLDYNGRVPSDALSKQLRQIIPTLSGPTALQSIPEGYGEGLYGYGGYGGGPITS